MNIDSNELRTILEGERFSAEEMEAFSTVADLQQKLSEIHEEYEQARATATTVYKSIIAKRAEKMKELEQEIEKFKAKVLDECKQLCAIGIHISKFNVGSTYINARFLCNGKYYCVYYCPICGEIHIAHRYPSYYTPPKKIKKNFWGKVSIPRDSVFATDEIKSESGKKTFIHSDYKISGERVIISELQKKLREAEEELAKTSNEVSDKTQKLHEKIKLIKSVLKQLADIEEKKKEYRLLSEQPERLCKLFGHDIEHEPYDRESTVICRCCGKEIRWYEVEEKYTQAKLAGMIDLCYVKHGTQGSLSEPRSVVYVYPREHDDFWDD